MRVGGLGRRGGGADLTGVAAHFVPFLVDPRRPMGVWVYSILEEGVSAYQHTGVIPLLADPNGVGLYRMDVVIIGVSAHVITFWDFLADPQRSQPLQPQLSLCVAVAGLNKHACGGCNHSRSWQYFKTMM